MKNYRFFIFNDLLINGISLLSSLFRGMQNVVSLHPFYKGLFVLVMVQLSVSVVSAQTTYYSRNGATAPRNWNEADSWTLNSDGSGVAAAVPGRNDNVIILSGHNIIINATDANGSTGESPESLGVIDTGAGDEVFPSSNSTMFYQTGDVIVQSGGTLSSTVRVIFEGNTTVDGALSTSDDLVNLGRLDVNAGSSLSVGDDFILAGSSETEININGISSDDLYIDHTDARLCGTGSLDLQGSGSAIQTYNSADASLQVCAGFTITGCPTCPFTGSGSFTLPIEIIEFKVVEGHLYWDVYQYEVYGFEIQFSEDIINWEAIGQVDSRGDGRNQYRYPIRNTGYYRIMSKEERPDYSRPIFYRSNEHTLSMYPSKMRNGQTLTITGYNVALVELLNTSGVIQKIVNQGLESIPVDVQPGMYLVRIHEEVGITTRKLLVY